MIGLFVNRSPPLYPWDLVYIRWALNFKAQNVMTQNASRTAHVIPHQICDLLALTCIVMAYEVCTKYEMFEYAGLVQWFSSLAGSWL